MLGMRNIMESGFEILYLLGGLVLSILVLAKARGRRAFVVFGAMGLTLVFGDAFHLVPRILNALGLGGENIDLFLGIGKLITSVSMTVFYVLLYHFFLLRYGQKPAKGFAIALYILAGVRIAYCVVVYNQWFAGAVLPTILRNLPFVAMGVMMVVFTYRLAARRGDKRFALCWLAITLSFAFYLATVVGVMFEPLMGMMMIPKTIFYVWLLVMGVVAVCKEKGAFTPAEMGVAPAETRVGEKGAEASETSSGMDGEPTSLTRAASQPAPAIQATQDGEAAASHDKIYSEDDPFAN